MGLSCFSVYFCFVWSAVDICLIHLLNVHILGFIRFNFLCNISFMSFKSFACLVLKIGHLLDLNLPSDLRSRLRLRAAGA
jgi:hypothetical protein